MLNITGITVRLGGRTILDRATAAIPPGSRVGLIGRNGAGKSTLMKVIIGQIEPDEGEIEMPRAHPPRLYRAGRAERHRHPVRDRARRRYRARRAARRSRALPRSPPPRRHPRPAAGDRRLCRRARAARILLGLGFDEEMQAQPLDSFSGGWKMRVALAALLFSAARPAAARRAVEPPRSRSDAVAREFPQGVSTATLIVISHERDLLNNVVDTILHLERGKITLYSGGYDAFEKQRAERARADRRGAGHRRTRSAPGCRIISPATAPAPRPPSRPSRGPRCWPRCSRSPRWPTIRA